MNMSWDESYGYEKNKVNIRKQKAQQFNERIKGFLHDLKCKDYFSDKDVEKVKEVLLKGL